MNAESVSIELPSASIRPWDQLLHDVRELEQQFDTQIALYMQFVRPTHNQTQSTDPQCTHLESKLQTILDDLQSVISEMTETVHANRGSRRVLERHQSMFHDYEREFQRYKNNVRATAKRTELNGAEVERDRMVEERGRIDQAHTDIDMVLENAFAVHGELTQQRGVIGGATSRLVDVSERIPGISMLLGRIRSRKRREKVVLAIVISACTCILLFVLT
ncbi:protein transport protein gos1 [Coemansia sp. RSA 1972]|nr:protein transport protein gos1 [Coemansia sp. RSA 1972]